jgi:ATP-dependent DNA ligase
LAHFTCIARLFLSARRVARSAPARIARVRLVSRNGRDHTRRFRDIATAVAKLSARSLVLDGEVAIYDQQLRSRFDWLREPDPAAVATPPFYMAFDLLYCDRRAIPSYAAPLAS